MIGVYMCVWLYKADVKSTVMNRECRARTSGNESV
jgi:hypothetical protein